MLEFIGQIIINIISQTGYFGVFVLMTLESALIPIPSEITMPFAGSLVAFDKFNFLILVLVGALGNLFGSLLAYGLGFWGEEKFIHQFIKKYGKYFLITEKEYALSEKWFKKYQQPVVFFSRLLPVFRTFISLPAGIAKMDLKKFILYTFFGSLIWSFFLTYIGLVLGENWKNLEIYFRKFDFLILLILVIWLFFYLKQKFKKTF